MAFTTTELIAQVKRLAHVPTNQNTFQTADFLALGDHQIRTKLVPLIKSVRESYFSKDKTYTLTSGTATYQIPARAVGGAVKDVVLVDSQGNEFSLGLIQEDEAPEYKQSGTGTPQKFYFKGNDIVLVPTPGTNEGSLKLPYLQRPSRLIATSSARQITAINTGTNTLTVSSVPSTFTTSTPLDFIKADPGFDCLAIDQTPSSTTSTTLVFSSSLPSGLAVGDWIALAGETPVPQLPVEYHEILASLIAERIEKAQGDLDALRISMKENEGLAETSKGLISPRVEGEPKKIIARSSTLSRRSWRW
jgi:hypothetical protein